MFTIVMTIPSCRVTELFFHIWTISYGPLNGDSYLYAYLIFIMTWSPTLKSKSIFVDFLWMTSFSICVYLRWYTYLQFAFWFIRRIMYRTNTNLPRIFPLVRWYIECIKKGAADKIPIIIHVVMYYNAYVFQIQFI